MEFFKIDLASAIDAREGYARCSYCYAEVPETALSNHQKCCYKNPNIETECHRQKPKPGNNSLIRNGVSFGKRDVMNLK